MNWPPELIKRSGLPREMELWPYRHIARCSSAEVRSRNYDCAISTIRDVSIIRQKLATTHTSELCAETRMIDRRHRSEYGP
jgi:hypothetical protein